AMGLEIAVSLGVVGVLGLLWLKGWTVGLGVVGSVAWSNATSFSFIAVPLFVFMSAILLHSGIGRGLFTAAARGVGSAPPARAVRWLAGRMGWCVACGRGGSVAWSAASGVSFVAVRLFGFMRARRLGWGVGRGLFPPVARCVGFLPGGLAVASAPRP